MKEITGPDGPLGASQVKASRTSRARAGSSSNASASELKRGTDGVSISGNAFALSRLAEVPDVRTDLVNRISAEVNDPDYDVDGKLDKALNSLFAEVFGG